MTLLDACPDDGASGEPEGAHDGTTPPARAVMIDLHFEVRDRLAELGLDRLAIRYGRHSIEHALSRVVWSEAWSSELVHLIEALRLKFLDHAALYCQMHPDQSSTKPNGPSWS